MISEMDESIEEPSSVNVTGASMANTGRRASLNTNHPSPQEPSLVTNRPTRSVAFADSVPTKDHTITTSISTTATKDDDDDDESRSCSIPNNYNYGFWYGNKFYSAKDTIGDTYAVTPIKVRTAAKSEIASTVVNHDTATPSDHIVERTDTVATEEASATGIDTTTSSVSKTLPPKRDKRKRMQETPINEGTPSKTEYGRKKWRKEVGSVSSSHHALSSLLTNCAKNLQ